jgi:hypothetical protein
VAEPPQVLWQYEVSVSPAFDLDVDARFRGPIEGGFQSDADAAPFVSVDSLSYGEGARAVRTIAAGTFAGSCPVECRLHYRVRLGDAARELGDPDVALAAGDAVFAPPSAWLVRPAGRTPEVGRYRFHVVVPRGMRFVSGVRPSDAARPDEYEADVRTFRESSFAAFGALRVPSSRVPYAELAVAPGLLLSNDEVSRWAGAELDAVTAYLGRPPDDRTVLFFAPGTSPVMRGETLGGGGGSVLVRIGTAIRPDALLDDWVLAHELLHVAFPSLRPSRPWYSEGFASYAEPVARVRVGLLDPRRFWRDLIEGLPQGVPEPGDRGLDHDDGWGRTYWGGALYFLLADIAVREQSHGARSLESAVRAVMASGANVESVWPIERVLEVTDRGTGTRVFTDLYRRLALNPGWEDLDALFARLGVQRRDDSVVFDDTAPLAWVRKAITAP